ncbi:MAG: cytochrome c3 family protein [Acidobacteriota bacterium]
MRVRLRAFLVVAVAVFFAAAFLDASRAQRRRGEFSHGTAAHKKINCSSCHKNPTANWATARGYPDVADFPGHASCISCHRADFFAGNKPAICAGCHTNPGPRGAARFPFPVRSRSREFTTIFPHDAHQDLIARNTNRPPVAVAHFVKARFSPADDPPVFANCAICHETSATVPKIVARKPVSLSPLANADPETFAPKAAFFKNSPDSHASCFTCHYQNQKPDRNNCAGCHSLTSSYFEDRTLTRFSLKFDHASTNHANKDCTTCHIRITQNSDLRTMKVADVPILTCSTSSCHGGAADGDPVIGALNIELGRREASITAKQPAFQCTFCHSREVGRFDVPESHKKP